MIDFCLNVLHFVVDFVKYGFFIFLLMSLLSVNVVALLIKNSGVVERLLVFFCDIVAIRGGLICFRSCFLAIFDSRVEHAALDADHFSCLTFVSCKHPCLDTCCLIVN